MSQTFGGETPVQDHNGPKHVKKRVGSGSDRYVPPGADPIYVMRDETGQVYGPPQRTSGKVDPGATSGAVRYASVGLSPTHDGHR